MRAEWQDDDWVGPSLSDEADRFDLDLDSLMTRVLAEVRGSLEDGTTPVGRFGPAPVRPGRLRAGRRGRVGAQGAVLRPPARRSRLVPVAVAAVLLVVGTALPGLGAWRSDGGGAVVRVDPAATAPTPSQTLSIAPNPPSVTAEPTPSATTSAGAARRLGTSFRWSSSGPLIGPRPDPAHPVTGLKDASVVYAGGKWHVFATTAGASQLSLVYLSFTDWADAGSAQQHYLDSSPIGTGYRAAPQVFWFAPQKLWYLVYQTGNASYSTNPDIGNPKGWSAPKDFYPGGMPDTVKRNIGGGYWVDMWVVCDDARCYLFSTDVQGHLFRSQTGLAQFPQGMSEPVVALQDGNRLNMVSSPSVYRVGGTGRYLLLMAAVGPDGAAYVRSWTSGSPAGTWTPLAGTESAPFAGAATVAFATPPGTRDINVGELIRSGDDQTLTVSPCHLRLVYWGQGERLGLLTQTNSACP